MQHGAAGPGRPEGDVLLAQPRPPERASLGSLTPHPTMSVRWAFNFTKWVPSYSQMHLATACVQIEEKERLAKFVFKNDFKASLIGRLMMRKYVCETSGEKYNEIKFGRDEKGKPFLEDKNLGYISCNVSHQGDFTVFAGGTNGALLGVDVVKVEFPRGKTLSEYFRLMGRIFSGREWEAVRGQTGERAQLATFCRFWCLKESYLKAIGVGVTINLQDVSFELNSPLKSNVIVGDTELFFKGERLPQWSFQEMLLDDDHCVAVASNQTLQNVFFKEIDFDELMLGALPLLNHDAEYCKRFFEKCEK